MSTASRAWIKPVIAAVAVAAIGIGAYATVSKREVAPQLTFLSIKGDKITPDSLKGKVVMVNFWATDCATCIKEMPDMVATYNKYKPQGLEFVAVAMSYDRPDYVVNYTETRQLPFKVALDVDGSAAKAYGNVSMTPTTFVIGKDGKILKRYLGEPDFPALHKLLDASLKG
ncbi:redoxin domain-containing protein [Duganella sp. FT50W]|uniref:Redoxin domain-containing protein n=1 Tax=Duganella lactea TaxID=2692173 RepID=A0A6L8MD42_9BURK|nr:TlpA disulfide reductase family protein [Duganella lactea]MYM32954.1 redoxin domain-containing protein [Duganella lactea]MYM80610.1 redoxin domain-containing protein [Duganella lactea]